MIVHLVTFDVDSYRYYAASDDFVEAHLMDFDGELDPAMWEPPPLIVHETRRPDPDFAAFNMSFDPIVGPRGSAFLTEELGSGVNLLPLEGGARWLANITSVEDVLDVESTDWRDPGPGLQRWAILVHRFRLEALERREVDLFRIPQMRWASSVFCTDGFRERYEDAGLTGLRFRQVWSDEASDRPGLPSER